MKFPFQFLKIISFFIYVFFIFSGFAEEIKSEQLHTLSPRLTEQQFESFYKIPGFFRLGLGTENLNSWSLGAVRLGYLARLSNYTSGSLLFVWSKLQVQNDFNEQITVAPLRVLSQINFEPKNWIENPYLRNTFHPFVGAGWGYSFITTDLFETSRPNNIVNRGVVITIQSGLKWTIFPFMNTQIGYEYFMLMQNKKISDHSVFFEIIIGDKNSI